MKEWWVIVSFTNSQLAPEFLTGALLHQWFHHITNPSLHYAHAHQ